MADKVKQFTIYRIKNLDRAEQEYYRTLQRTLDKIENDVVRLAGRDLPTQQGKLIELQSAVAIRPKIRTILQTEFLGWADTVTKQGFNRQAKRIERAFREVGNIPVAFQQLTESDLTLIQNLKRQTYTQFKDVSNTFTRRLSEKIYQYTLIGSDPVELEEELRRTINGIYASAKDTEVNELVKSIKRDEVRLRKLDKRTVQGKALKNKLDKNIQTLQSKFARDRAGENMKRYAGQILNDSLREFDATLNLAKSNDGQTGEIATDIMYDNLINKFKWGNMQDPSIYLDETNMRMTMNFRNNFSTLCCKP